MDDKYNINGAFQPTIKRYADFNGVDFYPTPKWATYALMENERFNGEVYECACGDGKMAEVIKEYNSVVASDLYEYGYGISGIDFLRETKSYENIITNPPFNSAENFVLHAYELALQKSAFLLRLAFLESAKRQEKIFNIIPPARVWVFSERITFYPRGQTKKGSGTTAYAWFVWDKQAKDKKTEIHWFPVGYKQKYGD